MVYAKKIKMRFGYRDSNRLKDIESILLDDENSDNENKKVYSSVGMVYDMLVEAPDSIKIFFEPYPFLKPIMVDDQKCVQSIAGSQSFDLLFYLTRS